MQPPAPLSSNSLRGALLSAAGAIAWSPDGLLMRVVHASSWQILFWRSLFFALSLLAILAVQHRGRVIGAMRRTGRLSLLYALSIAAVNLLVIYAFTHTTVANTLVILATTPLFGALFGRIIIGQPVRPRVAVTIVIAAAAIIAIFCERIDPAASWGDLSALLGAMLLAANLTVVRTHPEMALVLPLSIAGCIGAVAGWLMSDPFALTVRDSALLAASGAGQQTAGLFLFLSGARFLGPAEVGLLSLLETLLGPFWVWLVLAEAPTTLTIAAGSVVVVALAVNCVLGILEERRAGVAAPA